MGVYLKEEGVLLLLGVKWANGSLCGFLSLVAQLFNHRPVVVVVVVVESVRVCVDDDFSFLLFNL